MVWVGALQLLLDKGKELDWLESPKSSLLAVVTVLGFAYFLIWELTESIPSWIYPSSRGHFTVGAVGTSLGYGVFSRVVVMPLATNPDGPYGHLGRGLVTAPVGLLSVLLSLFRWWAKPCTRWTLASTPPWPLLSWGW